MEDYQDFTRYQDVFGQLRLLKSYNHFLLCFAIPNNVSHGSIIQNLEEATLKVTSAFPWMRGKVINEGSGPGDSGLFKVARCPLWEPPNTVLRVKDCTNLCPPFSDIIEAKGPIKMFDPDVVAPCVAFPQSYQESDSEPAAVVIMQANLVKGGLLLDLAVQHNIMPGGGMLQFLALLAKVMSGQSITQHEMEQGNRDRRNMVRLLDPSETPIDLSRFSRPSLLGKQLPAVPAPRGKWCTFRFSSQKLNALKSTASDASQFVQSVAFVSSNDTLTAFFWKRLTAIRLRRLPDPHTMSKFVRAVDVRSLMGVPNEYMGVMVYNTFSWQTFSEIEDMSLATLASIMRKNLTEDVSEYAVRSFVTRLASTPDKTTIMYGGELHPDKDVAFTSIAQSDIYNVNFGALGKPALFRRPNFIPKATTAMMLPKTLAGDTDLLVCLPEGDLDQLKADLEWCSYAELIDKD